MLYNNKKKKINSEIAHQAVAAIQPKLIKLTDEVQTLHKELQEQKKEKNLIELGVMPTQSFKEFEKFL